MSIRVGFCSLSCRLTTHLALTGKLKNIPEVSVAMLSNANRRESSSESGFDVGDKWRHIVVIGIDLRYKAFLAVMNFMGVESVSTDPHPVNLVYELQQLFQRGALDRVSKPGSAFRSSRDPSVEAE